jgi:undecaprenyl-diphosphatase
MLDQGIAVLLGVIEGVTEFLPVSSTGHLILAGSLLGFTGLEASVFEVFIQFGAVLSVIVLYKDKFKEMLISPFTSTRSIHQLRLAHVFAGILPVMAIGYVMHSAIKTYLFSPATVIVGLVAGGIFMLLAERYSSRPTTLAVEDMTIIQALCVGSFQVLSLWPGFSRSGATIAGGLCLGLSRTAAAEFSFIIAVPLMAVACLYDVVKMWSILTIAQFQMLAIGFIVAFVVAMISIAWLLRFLNKSTLAVFAYYRFALALLSAKYFYY